MNQTQGTVAARKKLLDSLTKEYAIIENALGLLESSGWCQGAEARDATGKPCHPTSEAAVKFSVSGAIYRAAADLQEWTFALYQRTLAILGHLPGSNDAPQITLEEILTILRRHVQLWKQREIAERETVAMIAVGIANAKTLNEVFTFSSDPDKPNAIFLKSRKGDRVFKVEVTEIDTESSTSV